MADLWIPWCLPRQPKASLDSPAVLFCFLCVCVLISVTNCLWKEFERAHWFYWVDFIVIKCTKGELQHHGGLAPSWPAKFMSLFPFTTVWVIIDKQVLILCSPYPPTSPWNTKLNNKVIPSGQRFLSLSWAYFCTLSVINSECPAIKKIKAYFCLLISLPCTTMHNEKSVTWQLP